jgi:CRP-like cAMP-binding protein/Zn-dependent protease
VVTEGDVGDRLFLIHSGSAEIAVSGKSGPVPLAALGPGELFGEIALLQPDGKRTATVTATTDLLVLSLAAPAFHEVLAAHPDARAAFEELAETLLVTKFLKQASPFSTLDGGRLRRLAARLERRTATAGEVIVRQGESGEECYLLRGGRAEVVAEQSEGGERSMATLSPGSLFGEAALLADAPRNATVRALERCELLVLRRVDMLEVVGEDRWTGARMLEMLRLRDRPRRGLGVEAHHRATATGETITVLKDTRHGTYYRLSPQGYFVWERLDGERTLRDLTLEYLAEFRVFAPEAIAGMVGGLTAAGFAEGVTSVVGVQEDVEGTTRWRRATAAACRVLEWQAPLRGVDPLLGSLYRVVRPLYTRVGQVLLAAVSLAGLMAFVLGVGELGDTVEASEAGGWLLLFWIPAFLVSIVVHEAGHALTTKHYGREVPRVGVGWYWFGPMAWVDTSDMWLENRWPRIAVSLAGPYAELVLGSVAALVAWLAPDPVLSAALWQFALLSYISVLVNFDPLMEFDGYYVLIDLLDKPNLRPRALAWLGNDLLPALRDPQRLRDHSMELLYGLGAVLYIVLMAALTVILYRVVVQGWLESVLPGHAAAALAWALAAAVVVLAIAGMVAELRGARRPAPGR